MKSASLKQMDIEDVILLQYPNLSKAESIKFVKTIFGSTATEKEINAAYNYLGK